MNTRSKTKGKNGENVKPNGATNKRASEHRGNESKKAARVKRHPDLSSCQAFLRHGLHYLITTDSDAKINSFDDGRCYYGQWADNVPNGFGTMSYPDGSVYIGFFEDGQSNGPGIRSSKVGDILFCDDSVEGGTCSIGDIFNKYNDEGDVYHGEWKNGKPHGIGIKRCRKNGAFHWGTFKHGLLNGPTCFEHYHADDSFERQLYIGGMKDNKFHGHGTSVYANGMTRIGEWRNSNSHGNGEYTWPCGSSYIGRLVLGKREGKGKFTFADGDEYDGEYKEGKQHGFGKRTFAKGDAYVSVEGRWEDNCFLDGVIKYTDGNEYEGSCSDDLGLGKLKREGRGTMRLCGGGVIEGMWKDDMFVEAEGVLFRDKKCSICLTNEVNAGFLHGDSTHNICCMECANKCVQNNRNCPTCRRPIDRVIKAYF